MKNRHILRIVLALVLISVLTGCGRAETLAQDSPVVSESMEIRQEAPTVIPDVTPTPSSIPEETPIQPEETEVPPQADVSEVTISFDFNRMSTKASNQFAVWIEDANGALVKTLFVPSFTAVRRGYREREDAVPSWVSAADPDAMTNGELDAISGATPGTGARSFSWDMTDEEGNRVPDGVYNILVEGTLYWSSTVLYTAELDTADAKGEELTVTETRSEPDNPENETMIENVRITVFCV